MKAALLRILGTVRWRRHRMIGGLVALAFGALASTAARAQDTGRVHRLAVITLNAKSVDLIQTLVLPELAKSNYVVGRNLVVDTRVGEADQLPRLVKDVLEGQPDAILAINSTAVAAVQAATRSIPIIMFGGDPVTQGFTTSIARPEGNITGITIAPKELDTKRLDLLRETVPNARHIAVLVHPTNVGLETRKQEMRTAAKGAGVELAFVDGPDPAAYGAVLDAARAQGAQALAINADSRFNRDAALLARLALERGLPTVCEWGEMAKEGCLIGYGPVLADLYRRTAYYAVRLFEGASPSQVPIEGPSRLSLVVNVRTARALGLKVSDTLLLQADEVIE